MLKHNLQAAAPQGRTVILGAGGFVGKAAAAKLAARGVEVAGIARQDIDLLSRDATGRLASALQKGDTLVVISAKAPVKNNGMLIDNLRMINAVCEAIAGGGLEQVLYVSSDAVYADSEAPLTEASCAQPASLHGAMHLAREIMLAEACKVPLCILRPTLIYGARDPHNGYGPNRFRRLAEQGEEIVLFGEGEERRDHVYIDDVAEILARCVVHKSQGVLNVASGTVTSFRDVARAAVALVPTPPAIRGTPRSGPMPHRGYRAFDSSATARVFPDFRYTPLELGLALSRNQEFGHG